MELKRGIWIGLLIVVAFHTAQAQRTTPQLSGPVVDEAEILAERTEQHLAAIIKAHEDSTSNQLAVLTITSLEGEDVEEYSLKVARTWALGQADKNNGVLMLVAVADRKIRIEVGYGLEGVLPDITAKRIIDGEITPHFRNGDYDSGVVRGVESVLSAIEGSYVASEATAFSESLGLRLQVGGLILIFPLLVIGTGTLKSCLTLIVRTLFVTPFIFVAGAIVWPPFGGIVLVGLVYGCLFLIRGRLRRSEKWGPILDSIKNLKPGEAFTFEVNGLTWTYRGASPRSGSGSSSSGSSSGSSFFSSSGYSGGGGSFGGGGASGSW